MSRKDVWRVLAMLAFAVAVVAFYLATRLANVQKAIQADHPDAAQNLADVRGQLARITKVAYDALGIEVPVLPPI